MQIYHNPRCSKSRQTLQLLQDKGISPEVVLYLETPPSAKTLKTIIAKLGLSSARELMRTKEEEYRDQGLAHENSESKLIAAMVATPKLIERPIVVNGDSAAIGRPPENVLAIL